MPDVKDTKNFRAQEFACKCCGKNCIKQPVLEMCQKIRDKLGCAVRVNSGYRCEKHNASVGGVKNSQHVQGNAADLSCEKGALSILLTVHELYLKGELPELSYCIYYPKKNFCHVDVGAKRNNLFAVSC